MHLNKNLLLKFCGDKDIWPTGIVVLHVYNLYFGIQFHYSKQDTLLKLNHFYFIIFSFNFEPGPNV